MKIRTKIDQNAWHNKTSLNNDFIHYFVDIVTMFLNIDEIKKNITIDV